MFTPTERVHVTVGTGRMVHLASKGSAHTLCGSGYCTTGIKRRSSLRVVKAEITCKKCLKREQEAAANQFGVSLYNSLVGSVS